MKACEKCRGLIVEALYNELNPHEKAFFEEHITSCPHCASEYKALTETLRLMDKREPPDPGREFWDGYWDRLARRLEKEKTPVQASAPWWRRLTRFAELAPRWAYRATAAALLVVVGIIIGRMLLSPPQVPVDQAGRTSQTQLLQQIGSDPVLRARDYFDRSKLVLLALVNYNPSTEDPYALDLPRQKKIAQELVTQAGYLKSELKDPGQRRLRELVADLEAILLQIANLEAANDLEAVEFVKQGVENRGILLKIDLSEMGGDRSKSKKEAPQEKTPSHKTSI